MSSTTAPVSRKDLVTLSVELASGKVHTVALPRTATVQELAAAVRAVAELPATTTVAVAVDGAAPSSATTLGELVSYSQANGGAPLRLQCGGESSSGIGATAAGLLTSGMGMIGDCVSGGACSGGGCGGCGGGGSSQMPNEINVNVTHTNA